MKKLSIVLSMLLLFIQSTFGLFYDFESNNQADDWQIFAGKGYIEDGKYIIEKTGATDAIAAIGDMTWTDCTVKCKGTLLDGSTDNIGLVWRMADGNMFYVVSLRMDQQVGYCGCINGAWMNGGAPINPVAFKTELNVDYEFELIVKGKKFQFFLDGEDMGSWEDSQLETGMVGVRTWNAKMAIDDFDINGPGIKPSAVGSQGKLAVAWGGIKEW